MAPVQVRAHALRGRLVFEQEEVAGLTGAAPIARLLTGGVGEGEKLYDVRICQGAGEMLTLRGLERLAGRTGKVHLVVQEWQLEPAYDGDLRRAESQLNLALSKLVELQGADGT